MTIPAKLQLVFDQGKDPQTLSISALNEALGPVAKLMTDVQSQLSTHRQLILDAQISDETDAQTDSQLERLNQTIRAIDRDVAMMLDSLRRVRRGCVQYGKYCADTEQRALDRAAKQDPPTGQ